MSRKTEIELFLSLENAGCNEFDHLTTDELCDYHDGAVDCDDFELARRIDAELNNRDDYLPYADVCDLLDYNDSIACDDSPF